MQVCFVEDKSVKLLFCCSSSHLAFLWLWRSDTRMLAMAPYIRFIAIMK